MKRNASAHIHERRTTDLCFLCSSFVRATSVLTKDNIFTKVCQTRNSYSALREFDRSCCWVYVKRDIQKRTKGMLMACRSWLAPVCLRASHTTLYILFSFLHLRPRSSTQIQGQIYHQVGSLLPFADANYQFLQIYFIGNTEDEIDRRCTIATNARRAIVGELTEFFHAHN